MDQLSNSLGLPPLVDMKEEIDQGHDTNWCQVPVRITEPDQFPSTRSQK